jgi:nucleotide-binding universal stress UspA family protein
MYTNILVPVVFDDEHKPNEAFEVAQAISGPDAKITLLHVLEELPNYATSYIASDFLVQRKDDIQSRIKEWADGIEGASTAVITGHSARSILEWSEANAVDCIVVSSHKPGIQDYFLGGTAARVVRYAKCAVHVIR